MLGFLAFGASLLNAAGQAVNSVKKSEETISNANYQLGQLELKGQRLDENYAENQESLLASLDQALDAGTQGIWSATVAQRNNMSLAATTNTENQSIAYAQLASLQRQNSRAVGSTVQTVATSGFRNTGSGANAIAESEKEAQRSYDTQRRQIQLSAYEGYMQAANDYFSANVQIEGYRESMRNAQDDYDLKSSMLESQYNYEMEVLQGEQGYWEGIRDEAEKNKGKNAAGAFLGGLFGGVVDFVEGLFD